MPNCLTCVDSVVEKDSTGISYCNSCSRIIEVDEFISQVEFHESSGGTISVHGSYISNDGFSLNYPSRQVTLFNAKKKLKEMASKLQLNQSYVDRAHQLYKLALNYNATKGRRLEHVLASCLYIVCRTDKTPHILLDFSDVAECNIYSLGSTFLALCKSLNIHFESIIDPCIFIWRYAKRLEFGNKIKVVVDSALDLVRRMKRDWIHVGRRPDGVCGAALLISARMHNFSRSINEVVTIVRCCNGTLRKRLTEFEDTPSASLAVSEFESIFLEEEHDPPSFLKHWERNTKKMSVLPYDQHEIENLVEVIEDQLITTKKTTSDHQRILSSDPDNLEDVDDDEIEECILNNEEIEVKTIIWNLLNKDYLLELAEKEERKKREIELGLHPKKKERRKGNKRTANSLTGDEEIKEKTKSQKLNYSALKSLGLIDDIIPKELLTETENVHSDNMKKEEYMQSLREKKCFSSIEENMFDSEPNTIDNSILQESEEDLINDFEEDLFQGQYCFDYHANEGHQIED